MAATGGDFAVPDGLPALLKDFAKEVLRAQARKLRASPLQAVCLARKVLTAEHAAQPADLHAFAAQYFTDLAGRRAAPGAPAPPPPAQAAEGAKTAEEEFMEARSRDAAEAAAAAAALAGAALEARPQCRHTGFAEPKWVLAARRGCLCVRLLWLTRPRPTGTDASSARQSLAGRLHAHDLRCR